MKKLYFAPQLVSYGSIANVTAIFGGPSDGDVLVDENGVEDGTGKNSIDACAEKNGKCICEDNGSC